MTRGFYTAGTGLITQTKKMDTLANNIANAGTSGFKKDVFITETFEEALFQRQEGDTITNIGSVTFGARPAQISTDFTEGVLEQTGNALHAAITGNGFFTVRANGQTAYTKNGEFFIDSGGYLCGNVGRIQGMNGDLYIGGSALQFLKDGTVLADGKAIDKLRIYAPQDMGTMKKLSDGTFTAAGAAGEFKGQVLQGYTECSNTDMTQEMMNIMASQRAYQANSQVLKMIDESLEKANEVGKL